MRAWRVAAVDQFVPVDDGMVAAGTALAALFHTSRQSVTHVNALVIQPKHTPGLI